MAYIGTGLRWYIGGGFYMTSEVIDKFPSDGRLGIC